jgi:hypothetical protein
MFVPSTLKALDKDMEFVYLQRFTEAMLTGCVVTTACRLYRRLPYLRSKLSLTRAQSQSTEEVHHSRGECNQCEHSRDLAARAGPKSLFQQRAGPGRMWLAYRGYPAPRVSFHQASSAQKQHGPKPDIIR